MPIHLDEAVAKAAGLPGIIVHGLCTLAFTSWATLTQFAAEDASRIRRLAVRFSKPVLPGQDITTSYWQASQSAEAKVCVSKWPSATPSCSLMASSRSAASNPEATKGEVPWESSTAARRSSPELAAASGSKSRSPCRAGVRPSLSTTSMPSPAGRQWRRSLPRVAAPRRRRQRPGRGLPRPLHRRGSGALRGAAHHRQQRRLHLGQRHPEDVRRAVGHHPRPPPQGAVPDPARRPAGDQRGRQGRAGRGRARQRKVVNISSLAGVGRQRRAGQLLRGQGRSRRSDAHAVQGVGPVERDGQRRRLRAHRHAPHTAGRPKARPSTWTGREIKRRRQPELSQRWRR